MKTILRAQHKRARKSALQKTIFAVIFLGLIGLLNYFAVNPFSRISTSVSSVVWTAKEQTQRELNDFYALLRSKQGLVLENNKLTQELLDQEHTNVSLEALRIENDELKHLLGRTSEKELILGAVISRPYTSPYDTLVIDIGSEDGVGVGAQVMALGDFVVGFVTTVFPQTSQVTFYSSPGVKTNILIGEQRIPATAEGRGGNNFITQLPRDSEVAVGDVVTLSHFDTQVFAVVEEVIRSSTDAFQTVLFKNPVNIFNTKWIQVVVPE